MSFVYKSRHAHPVPMLPLDISVRSQSPVPPKISYQTTIGGVKQGLRTFVSTSGFNENIDETLRAEATFDASALKTGIYPYRLCTRQKNQHLTDFP